MESGAIAFLMSILTASAGFLGIPLEDAESGSHSSGEVEQEPENFEYDSAHEHALFFLNVDREEVNFTQREYQVQSRYVHLENFKPHIVHKHTENVTWKYFLDTIDVEVNESSGCVEFKSREECGNLSVVINGEESGLEREIQQDDNLAILLDARNMTDTYMERQLPENYRKTVQGRGV